MEVTVWLQDNSAIFLAARPLNKFYPLDIFYPNEVSGMVPPTWGQSCR